MAETTSCGLPNEFEWKALNPEALEQMIQVDRHDKTTGCLAYLSVEITLTDRIAFRREPFRRVLDKYNFDNPLWTADTFRPQTYTLRLEVGDFVLPIFSAACYRKRAPEAPNYALRLTFDKSPYPRCEQWYDLTALEAPAGRPVYEWKEFMSQKIIGFKAPSPSNCVTM